MDRLGQTQLGDALNRAAAPAPPTGINVDDIIVEHRRQVRRRRWSAAAAAVAALAFSVLAATHPDLYGHRAGPFPIGDPEPNKTTATTDGYLVPTEPASLALPRLDRAVRLAVGAALAGWPPSQIP